MAQSYQSPSHHNQSNQSTNSHQVSSAFQSSEQAKKLDEQFVLFMLEIENRYKNMSKHERIRVEQWSKVLCHVTNNVVWKKNRNLYTLMLLDQILQNKLEKPFLLQPPDGGLPLLSKAQVVSLLNIQQNLSEIQFKFLQMAGLSNKVKDLRIELDSNSIKQRLFNQDQDKQENSQRQNQNQTISSKQNSRQSLDMPRQNSLSKQQQSYSFLNRANQQLLTPKSTQLNQNHYPNQNFTDPVIQNNNHNLSIISRNSSSSNIPHSQTQNSASNTNYQHSFINTNQNSSTKRRFSNQKVDNNYSSIKAPSEFQINNYSHQQQIEMIPKQNVQLPPKKSGRIQSNQKRQSLRDNLTANQTRVDSSDRLSIGLNQNIYPQTQIHNYQNEANLIQLRAQSPTPEFKPMPSSQQQSRDNQINPQSVQSFHQDQFYDDLLSSQPGLVNNLNHLNQPQILSQTYDETFQKNQDQKVSKFLSEIAQLKTQVEVLTIQNQHLKDEISSKNFQLSDQTIAIEDYKMQVERYKQTIESMRDQQEQLREQFQYQLNQIKARQQQISEEALRSQQNTQRVINMKLIEESEDENQQYSYKNQSKSARGYNQNGQFNLQERLSQEETTQNRMKRALLNEENKYTKIGSVAFSNGPQSPPSINQLKPQLIQDEDANNNNLINYLTEPDQNDINAIDNESSGNKILEYSQGFSTAQNENLDKSPSSLVLDELLASKQQQQPQFLNHFNHNKIQNLNNNTLNGVNNSIITNNQNQYNEQITQQTFQRQLFNQDNQLQRERSNSSLSQNQIDMQNRQQIINSVNNSKAYHGKIEEQQINQNINFDCETNNNNYDESSSCLPNIKSRDQSTCQIFEQQQKMRGQDITMLNGIRIDQSSKKHFNELQFMLQQQQQEILSPGSNPYRKVNIEKLKMEQKSIANQKQLKLNVQENFETEDDFDIDLIEDKTSQFKQQYLAKNVEQNQKFPSLPTSLDLNSPKSPLSPYQNSYKQQQQQQPIQQTQFINQNQQIQHNYYIPTTNNNSEDKQLQQSLIKSRLSDCSQQNSYYGHQDNGEDRSFLSKMKKADESFDQLYDDLL